MTSKQLFLLSVRNNLMNRVKNGDMETLLRNNLISHRVSQDDIWALFNIKMIHIDNNYKQVILPDGWRLEVDYGNYFNLIDDNGDLILSTHY